MVIRLALCSSAFLAFASVALGQTTWHVPGDAPSISAAIQAAASGDTIVVGPGTWNVHGLVWSGKDLTLRSSAGPEATILHGQDQGRILVVGNGVTAASRIEGFTFTRGRADAGGAVLVQDSASPVFETCVFRENRTHAGTLGLPGVDGPNAVATGAPGGPGGPGQPGTNGGPGGAVFVLDGSPLFLRCIFFDNRAGPGGKGGTGGTGGTGGPGNIGAQSGHGGAGGIGGVGGLGGPGGAIAVAAGAPKAIGCFFRLNRAGPGGPGGNGGAGGQPGVNPWQILGSVGPGGPGREGTHGGPGSALAAIGPMASLTAINCTFVENFRSTGGGGGAGGVGNPNGTAGPLAASGEGAVGAALNGALLTIRNSIFHSNSASQQDLFAASAPTPTVESCITDYVPLPAGSGNFMADPLFLPAPLPWRAYRVSAGSPAIDVADGSALPSGVGRDLDGHPRRLDDPATPDGALAGVPPLDIGAAEYTPPAQLVMFDCAANPPASFVHWSGSATPGQTLVMQLANPLGTQGTAFVFGVASLGSYATTANPCGLSLAGFGMGGPGALGGIALDIAPDMLLPAQFVGMWIAGPLQWHIDFPPLPGLHGIPLALQGVFVEVTPADVPIAVTRAARVVIGA